MSSFEFQYNVGDDDEEVTIQVDSFRPGKPAQTYGPPERCYEAEADEVEYSVIRADGSEYTKLTPREEDSIYGAILDKYDAMKFDDFEEPDFSGEDYDY